MEKKKDGGPAFPVSVSTAGVGEHLNSGDFVDGDGMTLRDYFAAKALGGYRVKPEEDQPSYANLATWAYEQADAMLVERAK